MNAVRIMAPPSPLAVVLSARSVTKDGTAHVRLHSVRLRDGFRVYNLDRLGLGEAWRLVESHPHRDGLAVTLDPKEES